MPARGIGLVRFNADGVVDNTFGTNGKTIVPGSEGFSTNYVSDLAISPDRKLILIGLKNFRIFLNRLNVNGTLDTSFGTNGILVPDIDNSQVDIYQMAIQPDGKIIFPVANNRHMPVFSTIVRLSQDGTPDASFGTNGKVVIPVSEGIAYDPVLIQPNGKIVIGGCAVPNAAPPFYFAITHLNADGSRDTTFGSNGTVTNLLASYGGCISDLALQPDGKLLAVGGVQTYESDLDIGLARFLSARTPAVEISGRVTTPDGRGLRNATVTLTDSLGATRTATTSSFGFYTFGNVPAGDAYVIGVSSRLYRFASRNLVVNENMTNVDFVGLE